MGYYPTQEEIHNMQNEVRFSSITESGQPNLSVNFETFIKLFVNHRPVYGIGKNNIEDAFKALMEDSEDVGQGGIHRETLLNELRNNGEPIDVKDLEQIFANLVSEFSFANALKDNVTADYFAEDILGFEEVDEDDDEAGEDGEPGQSQISGAIAASM